MIRVRSYSHSNKQKQMNNNQSMSYWEELNMKKWNGEYGQYIINYITTERNLLKNGINRMLKLFKNGI